MMGWILTRKVELRAMKYRRNAMLDMVPEKPKYFRARGFRSTAQEFEPLESEPVDLPEFEPLDQPEEMTELEIPDEEPEPEPIPVEPEPLPAEPELPDELSSIEEQPQEMR